MNMRKLCCLQVIALLLLSTGCSDAPRQAESQDLVLSEVLGGDDTAGYLRAIEPRAFNFPQDHGPHRGFRNEWWYLTGNLATDEGRRFGYQVTFFNSAQPGAADDSASEIS